MSTWLGLLNKEYRVGRTMILVALIGLFSCMLIAYFVGMRFGDGLTALLGVAVALVFPHSLYLLIYMFTSLSAERKKLHLWLHNPMPGSALYGAKLINGVAAMFFSLLITCLVILACVNGTQFIEHLPFNLQQTLSIGIFTAAHVMMFAVYITIWFIFYWTIYIMLKPRIGGWSVPSIIIFYFFLSWLFDKFRMTPVYEALTHWGGFSAQSFITGLHFSGYEDFSPIISDFTFFLGTYVFHLILSVILFFISCWILDQKVEA